jgi:molybdopterin-containing oxidoreductase family iron-sulfur binding subunit
MSIDRRKFMKITGLAALGLAVGRPPKLSSGMGSVVGKNETTSSVKRLAMAIDVRKCIEVGECDKCLRACHVVHNVPDFGNPKDEVKWIWKESFEHAFHEQEHDYLDETLKHALTPVLCNHCDNPPCVRVCPTQATWKRESDGVVMIYWHRCIGCRYCILACPYGSRSFNWRDPRPFIDEINPDYPTRTRGVVEKCTFCEERLSRDLIPSCVEACKEKALVFGDLEDPDSDIRKLLRKKFSIRRNPGLGTQPEVYYIV